MIVQGIEGNEDVPTSRPCRVFQSVDGEMQESRLNPQDYDLLPASAEELAGGDAAYNADVLLQVLEGEVSAHRDLVVLNAGIRIYLAERAESIGEGVDRAREAIDSGAAQAKLESLRQRAISRV